MLQAIEIFKKTLPPLAGDHATLTALDLTKAERLLLMDAQHKLVQEEKFPLWKKCLTSSSMAEACGDAKGNLAMLTFLTQPDFQCCYLAIITLVILEAHNRVQHNGVKETLTVVQRRF